jgi:cell wall-associated NlpC family hydrolase
VYAHFGVTLPHSSYAQFGDGHRVSRQSLRPGDLVFFDAVGHVGIYVGNGRFIHAPHTGTRVSIEKLGGWYSSRFSGARRLRNA